MLFSANIAVEQGVIVAVIMIALFTFTLLRCTKTRVQSNPSSEFALIHRLPKKVTKLVRMWTKTCILSNC